MQDTPAPALSLSLAEPVEVRFDNLCYEVQIPDGGANSKSCPNPLRPPKTRAKRIIDNVSGVFKPGKLTAVMGASGAGKTSLLSVLAGLARGGTVRGSVQVNGAPANPRALRSMSAFVEQDDVIMHTMTVREALTMAATLRLPAHTATEERQRILAEMLAVLKLEDAADTVVGDSETKGISGGERKRLAIGMALISNPPLLWADECTSGLDTFTGMSLFHLYFLFSLLC